MSISPYTLRFMTTVAGRADREDSINRRTSGFEYFLLVPFFPVLLYWMLLYGLIRLKYGH